jgi:hypothetical protein
VKRSGEKMRNKENTIFLSAAHLEERAAARTWEAEQLPLGEARQHALNNAAQLRSYAMRACSSKYDLNQDQPL